MNKRHEDSALALARHDAATHVRYLRLMAERFDQRAPPGAEGHTSRAVAATLRFSARVFLRYGIKAFGASTRWERHE